MRIEFVAAADHDTPDAGAGTPAKVPVFIEDYPKSGPVLESSYLFPKVESYGVWKIYTASGPTAVSEDC
jgi:hypothetical protein